MQEIESNADRYLKIVQLQFPVSINILHDYINEKS